MTLREAIGLGFIAALAACGPPDSSRSGRAEPGPPPTDGLNDAVTPKAYVLELSETDDGALTGRASLSVKLEEPAAYVWLHGAGLTVSESALITTYGGRTSTSYAESETPGLALVDLGREWGALNVTLEFEFTASALEPDGAPSAPALFPVFDEPRFVTPYEISIHVRNGDTIALSGEWSSEEAARQIIGALR